MAIPSIGSSSLKVKMESMLGVKLHNGAKVTQFMNGVFAVIFDPSQIDWNFLNQLFKSKDFKVISQQLETKMVYGFMEISAKDFVVRFKDLKSQLTSEERIFKTAQESLDISVIDEAIEQLKALQAKPENLALKDTINGYIEILEKRKMDYEVLRHSFVQQKMAFLTLPTEAGLVLEKLLEITKAMNQLLALAKKNLNTPEEKDLFEEMKSINDAVVKPIIGNNPEDRIFKSAELSNDTKKIQAAIDALKVIQSIYDNSPDPLGMSFLIHLHIRNLENRLELVMKTVERTLLTLSEEDPV